MAIDTAAKQMSMLNFGDGNTLTVLPIPDGGYVAADWQHLLDLYSGVLPGVPGIILGDLEFMLTKAVDVAFGQLKTDDLEFMLVKEADVTL